MKKVGVAILGLGVVGGGAYKILTENREFYRQTQDVDLVVVSVLEKSPARIAKLGVPEELVAHNIAEIASDPEINIVVECIGGVEAAKEYVHAALYAGKTVVTSNKELICKYSNELERSAKRHNAGIFFEASCVGGIPIVRTLIDGLQSDRISSVMGIVNGTTNFILSEMSENGLSYAEALNEAQKRGYTESDPSADVEGYDAAYKLSILASLAFHTKIPYTKVFREGITGISPEDIADGKALGYTLKLLAIGKYKEDGVEARVHPAFVRKDHPLASVNGGFNAVFVSGEPVGDVMLYGKGAGPLPAGSAVVSDVIYAATHAELRYSMFQHTAADRETRFVNDFKSGYYLRLTASDEAGVLANIASILGKYGVSVVEMFQRASKEEAGKATLVFVTHETREFAVRNAVAKLNATGRAKVESVLRVAL